MANDELITRLTNEMKERLISKTSKALPNNPSERGFTSEQIKDKMGYEACVYLFDVLKTAIDNIADAFDDVFDGTLIAEKANKDANGNVIHTTYETKADAASKDALNAHLAGAETFTGKKTFTGGAEFSTANVKIGSSGSDNSKSFDIYYTTNLRGPVVSNTIIPGNTFALGSAEHYWGEAFIDDLYLYGSISDGLYEWTLPAKNGTFAMTSDISALETELETALAAEVAKFKDGTYTSKKAQQDEDGNTIKSTYIKIASLVNNLTSTSTTDPLTAYQGKLLKDSIDAINAVLSSNDADLDTIQELVTYVKNNKSLIDSITTLKVSVADIIDNLTSQVTNKPLSANQGYVLKGLIDSLSTAKIAFTDIVNNLTTNESAKPLSAAQGYVLKGLIDDLERYYLALSGIAEDYDSTSTYSKGDVVANSGNLFRAKADITTAEEWTAAHWDEVNIVELIKEITRGLNDGTLIPSKALTAEEIAPVSEESGTIQDTPFISQGTGTENNTGSTDTSPVGKQLEKQGNTLVVNNQMGGVSASSTTINGITFTNNNDGTFTLSGVAEGNAVFAVSNNRGSFINGHKIYWGLSTTTIAGVVVRDNYTYLSAGAYTVSTWSSANFEGTILVVSGTDLSTPVKVRPLLIDLTQMFNGDIPQDLLDNPDHFSWYYNGSLAYNTGTLKNADGRYLVCTGRQLWDEVAESGGINGTTGENEVVANRIRSKNYIPAIPSRTYYAYTNNHTLAIYFYDRDKNFISSTSGIKDTTFTAPSNARFIRFQNTGENISSYANDITISLYYTPEQGGEGYDQHYDYEEPKVYDTGTEELLAAGILNLAEGTIVRDVKLPSGKITRKVVSYTFQSGIVDTTWQLNGKYYQYANTSGIFGKEVKGSWGAISIRSDKLNCVTQSSLYSYGDTLTNSICLGDNGKLGISQDLHADKSKLSGATIYVELVTYEEEQGTAFSENIEIDDYGMMYWLDTDGNLVDVPQGVKLFYPAWYAGFTDSLYARTSGNAGNVVVQSELAGYEKVVDKSSDITNVAGLTYTIKKAYKVGNLVTLTIFATNNTGSTINKGTTLATLSSGLFNASRTLVMPCVYYKYNQDLNSVVCCMVSSSGNVAVLEDFSNNDSITIELTYAVA